MLDLWYFFLNITQTKQKTTECFPLIRWANTSNFKVFFKIAFSLRVDFRFSRIMCRYFAAHCWQNKSKTQIDLFHQIFNVNITNATGELLVCVFYAIIFFEICTTNNFLAIILEFKKLWQTQDIDEHFECCNNGWCCRARICGVLAFCSIASK